MISSNECNDFQPHHIAQTGSLVGRKSRRFEYLGCMIVQFRFYFLLLYPLHLLMFVCLQQAGSNDLRCLPSGCCTHVFQIKPLVTYCLRPSVTATRGRACVGVRFFVLMIEIDILLCIGQQRCAEVSPFRAKEAGEYARLLSQSLQLDVIQLDLLG